MRLLLSFLFIVMSLSTIAYAQQDQENDTLKIVLGKDIIVTGFPSDQSRMPIPVVSYAKPFIERTSETEDVPSMLAFQPSMVYYSQSGLTSGYSFLNIRGFDQRRMSILINGIPQNDPEDHNVYWIDIPDISSSSTQLHIQRGAGSAFYGPPAIGGSINIVTAPSPVRTYNFSSSYGSYNTSKFSLDFQSGMNEDGYAMNARLSRTKTDGYRNHSFQALNSYYLSLLKIGDVLTYQVNVYGGAIEDGLDYYGIFPNEDRSNLTDKVERRRNWSETGEYERRPNEGEKFSQPHYEILSTWNINDKLRMENSLFYIQGDGYFDFDGTWVKPFTGYSHSYYYRLTPEYAKEYGFTPLMDSTLGNELTRGYVGNKQFGWLPRFDYTAEDYSLSFGAEVRFHRSLHWGQLLSAAKMPVDLPGDYHFYEYKGAKDILSLNTSNVFFTQSPLKLFAALQYINQEYRFFDEKPYYIDSSTASTLGIRPGFTSNTFSVPYSFFNPRIGLLYSLLDNMDIYGSLSVTSREPRLKDYYGAEFFSEPNFEKTQFGEFDYSKPTITEERLMDVEIGLRSKFDIDNIAIKYEAGGYYMPFTNELLKTGKVDRFGSSVVANAESVLHYGFEATARLQYEDILEVNASILLSHNEIKEFSKYIDPVSIVGKTPIGFPSKVITAAVLGRPFEGLDIMLRGRMIGEMYGDLDNSDYFKNDAYTVIDANIGYTYHSILGANFIRLALDINNIFDANYISYVERSAGFFVGAPRNLMASIQIGL